MSAIEKLLKTVQQCYLCAPRGTDTQTHGDDCLAAGNWIKKKKNFPAAMIIGADKKIKRKYVEKKLSKVLNATNWV